MQNVNFILNKMSYTDFQTILKFTVPSDNIFNKKLPEITSWKFCDVMDMLDKNIIKASFFVCSKILEVEEETVLNSDSRFFMSFCKHIEKEFKKIGTLMKQLESETDADLKEAGIDEMNVFGVTSIYYSISSNPMDWDAISELPFYKLYTKLLIDKKNNQIQKKYNEILQRKIKEKR